MKICVILNPQAGSAEQSSQLMEMIAEQENICAWTTSEAGHARALAGEAIDKGFDMIAAAGGDGTVHEVVNGIMMHGGKIRFGIVPLGTGNDLARTLALPNDPRDALALLMAGRSEWLDLIRVEAEDTLRYVVNAAAGGFSGQVDEVLSPEMKTNWGPLAYLMSAVAAAPDLTGYHTMMSYDDGPAEAVDAVNIIVANGRTVTGGKRIAPWANPQDGLLDVTVVTSGSVLDMAAVATRLLTGTYLGSPNVIHRKAHSLKIVSKPGMWFNVDGELLTKEPITFTVIPAALEVIVGLDYQANPPGAPLDEA